MYESIASIQFMGFTREKAAHIFGHWIRRPDPGETSLCLFDYIFVSVGPWRFSENVEAGKLLTELGISEELKAVLLDPKFTHRLKSKTLAYWVRDTVQSRHETLQFLMRRVKLCASSQEHVSDHGSPEGRYLGWIYEDYGVPSGAVSIDPENNLPPIPANHYVMYRPMALGRHFPVDSEGEIPLHVLRMGPDLNDNEWLLYSDLEAAEDYREWIVARCPYTITWMLRMVLPYLFMDGIPRHFVSKEGPLWTIKRPRLKEKAYFPTTWKENGTNLEEILQEELRGKFWIDIQPAVIPEREADIIQDTKSQRTSDRYGCTSRVVELGYRDGEWADERIAELEAHS